MIQEIVWKSEAKEVFNKYFKTPIWKYGDSGDDFKVLPRLNKIYVICYGNNKTMQLSNFGGGLYLWEII